MARRKTFDPIPSSEPYEQQLLEAALLVKARLAREAHPEGRWEGGVWLPSESERQACCEEVAPPEPIRGRQQTLENHCRTLLHVAYLKEVGVDDLRRKWRELGFKVRPSARRTAEVPSETGLLISRLEKLRSGLEAVLDEVTSLLDTVGGGASVSETQGGETEREEDWALDSRINVPVGKADRERWLRAAEEEGLDVSQWVRRVLNRTLGPLPASLSEDQPLSDALELRVNSGDKERWRQSARSEGLGLAKWVRRALNAAVTQPRGQRQG